MHENNFEKQVREKMDHLGFDPSGAVWTGVDKEINKEKKRRRPLFWLFFFSGLLLAGGGYYFVASKNSSKTIANPILQSEINKKQERLSASQVEISTNEKKKENSAGKKLSEGNGKWVQPSDFKTGNARLNKLVSKGDNLPGQITNNGLNGKGLKDSIILNPGKDELSTGGEGGTGKKMDSSAENKITTPAMVKSSLKDSVTNGKIASEKNQKKKSSSWKIGFTGSAGISNINQSLFTSAYTSYPAYAANPPAGSTMGATGGFYGSSNLSAGFAFGVGVFVNRNLSKRISFSAGMNYRYYSTKINTGNKVDSSIYVYTGSVQSYPVNSFYRNAGGNTYINQYQFVELPLSVNFQLNRSNKTPVIWDAGLSLAWLVSSNALHFDPYSNVYYKNNQLFNKTQINTATAILVGFNLHHAELQLGPQLLYGLTGLLKGSTASPEHLFYFGLKVSIIPGNK
jgi:hypothetical protein